MNNTTYRIRESVTQQTFRPGDNILDAKLLLNQNPNRVGFIVYNNSSDAIYLRYGGEAANSRGFSIMIGGQGEYEMPDYIRGYTGQITWNPVSGGSGTLMITEFSRVEERQRRRQPHITQR